MNVKEITKLCKKWGFERASQGRQQEIAGMIFGYGVSLLKVSGVPLIRVVEVLYSKWDDLQGGNGN